MNRALAVNRDALTMLCKHHRIKRLSMFGSAVREDFDSESDIDLLVEFEQGHVPSLSGLVLLQDELSEIFDGRKVDVATRSILKNPYRRRTIVRELEELYAA
jgi:predicted nucleotidyltransferase